MGSRRNQVLFEYYNERAAEYEAFYYGKFTTPHPEPCVYIRDRLPIEPLLANYLHGRCADIGCGTGFWLPYYHNKCTSITLIDQSEEMLTECALKIRKLGIEDKVKLIRSDIFNTALADGAYDSALIGFLISHFTNTELKRFFNTIKAFLKPAGRFVIIDSLWSAEIQKYRNTKAGVNTRELFNGRKFKIFKRYFEKDDLETMAARYNFNIEIAYLGMVFFLAAGQFKDAQA